MNTSPLVAASRWQTRPATAASYRSAVERVLGRMRADPASPLHLAEMAELARVSRCHFDRLFRQVTGLSPRQFQTALRLHAATRLLLTSERSVTDVCFDVGYESLGSFVTRFSATFGVSPQRLRRLAPSLEQPLGYSLRARASVPEVAAGVRGRIEPTAAFAGLVFVGLFRHRIPEAAPAACAILSRPGAFVLPAPPEGRYCALAVGLAPERTSIALLLDEDLPRGAARQPVWCPHRGTDEPLIVRLRPPEAIDPPINLVLPLLLRLTRARA